MIGVANYKLLLSQLISLLPQGWRHNIILNSTYPHFRPQSIITEKITIYIKNEYGTGICYMNQMMLIYKPNCRVQQILQLSSTSL